MSDKLGVAKAEDLKSLFLLYRFSTEDHASKDNRVQRTDVIDVLAVAGYFGIPCLPIIWQTARASVGLGGTSSIRRAPLDAQTELAFKLVKDEEKVFAKADDIFSLIWNEIRILGHPQLRDHRNIVDLLGLCWDIAEDNVVWPALVFEKSHFGDLQRFTNLPIWNDLTSRDKLKTCIDIGNALSVMHYHKIIHGDLKPHNILIFKDNNTFLAKVTDFGYSRQYSSLTDGYSLPLSTPWEAPEVDGSDKQFSLQQAKQADIYSYALLCGWILYQHRFQEIFVHSDTNSCLYSGEKAEVNSINLLQQLKSTGQLEKVVTNFVDGDDDLQPEHRVVLREFFHNALGTERSVRNETLWKSLKLLEQPNPDFNQSPTEADTPVIEFELGTAIEQYYQGDHRVRSYIAKCLQHRVNGAAKGVQTTNDTVQLAICYHIGFGVPRNEDKFQQLCTNEELTKRIHAAIGALDTTPKKFNHPLVRRILAEGNLGNLHQIGQNQNFALLQETENVLVRELEDLKDSIDDFMLKWVITRALIDCLRIQGCLDAVERLESQMLDFEMTHLGMDNLRTVAGMTNLAHLYWSQGKLDRALGTMEEALQASLRIQGPDEVISLIIMGNIAAIYYSLGEFDQAEELEVKLQEKRSALLGKDHPDTLTSVANQAAILLRQGKLHDAVALATQAYEARRKIFGIDYPDTVISMSNLALIYQGLERYDEAESLLAKAVDTSIRILGEDSPGTLMNMANLALNHWHRGKLQEAEDLGMKVVAKRRYVLGPDHPDNLTSIANLALVHGSQGRLEEARDLESDVLEKSRALLGDSHPDTLLSMDNLAFTYQNMKRWVEAETLLTEALATRKRVLGESHPETMQNTHKLLLVLYELGKEIEIREIGEHLANLTS